MDFCKRLHVFYKRGDKTIEETHEISCINERGRIRTGALYICCIDNTSFSIIQSEK